MSEEFSGQWQFGEFRLDTRAKVLWHRGTAVPMPLKELEVLCMLVENQGELVTKQAMLDEIWEDSFVGESNLSRHIYLLRKTLKDAGADEGLIENVPRRGYRFAGEVRPIEPDEIYVEKRTRTRTLVEFQDAQKTPSRLRIAAFASLLLVATVASAYLGYRYLATQHPDRPINSLAILPFRVVDTGPATSHSGAGLADILTTRLSNIKNVRVRPMGSSQSGEDQDPVATGKQMQVDAVVDGTIYYTNEKVRVTARLVRVSDASVEWSGEFEKLRKDEVQLQNELAQQIIPALAVNLSGDERDAVTKHYTQNADAYELYMKGRYEWSKRSHPGMVEAQRQFRNAIAADPSFALAYVGLADTLLMNQPSATEAWIVLSRALELDPNLAEAHASKGFHLMFFEWQWKEAESAFQKSLDLNPNYATAHHWYATLLAIKGDTTAAKAQMRKALELDPVSYNFLADLGQLYYFSGEYAEAEKYCLKALEIYPEFTRAHEYLHYIYLKTGQHDKAVVEIAEADEINSRFAHDSSTTYDALEKYRGAFRTSGISGYLELRYPSTNVTPESLYYYAIKHAVIGNNEKALEYLERSTESRMFMSAFVKADPIFEGLRSEHRYQEILRRMGLG